MSKLPPNRFAEWPVLRIRPTLAYQGEPPAAHRHISVTNGFYSFWLVEEGCAQVTGKFGKIRVREGEWIFFPPFLPKKQDFEEGTRLISIGFDASWAGEAPWMEFAVPFTGKSAPRNVLIMAARQVPAAFPSGSRGQPLLEKPMDAADIAGLQARLYSFVEKMTPYVLRHGGRLPLFGTGDLRLGKMAAGLRLSPSIRPLPYALWKKELGISRVHIDRLFRLEFGSSPKQQRNRFLLAALKRELITGRQSIKELAASFGFSDSSHLCRWFRQWAGISPEHFRSQGIE